MRLVLICVMLGLLTGCYGRINAGAGTGSVRSVPIGSTVSTSQVQLSSDTRLGAILIIGVMLADGIRYFRVSPDGARTPLEYLPPPGSDASAIAAALAPRISVQDCTRPIDPGAGNLVCR